MAGSCDDRIEIVTVEDNKVEPVQDGSNVLWEELVSFTWLEVSTTPTKRPPWIKRRVRESRVLARPLWPPSSSLKAHDVCFGASHICLDGDDYADASVEEVLPLRATLSRDVMLSRDSAEDLDMGIR